MSVSRTKDAACQRQVTDLRRVYGDHVTAHAIGITLANLDNRRLYPGSKRAVQLLWAITFRPGPVQLVDVLTSFQYTDPATRHHQKPQEPAPCGVSLVVQQCGNPPFQVE
jgi:hypothetical protein